jgi:poly-gamma-glutamate capsule biosynthesis protein CapA/YwtB (metallophosphatase superfamily)
MRHRPPGLGRRDFLKLSCVIALGAFTETGYGVSLSGALLTTMEQTKDKPFNDTSLITLFLCGDVMTGRGIDQVLPHPCTPRLYESYVTDAQEYVALAERKNGPIPKPVEFGYIWGDALGELERLAPDVRIINLETAVTQSDEYWKGKGINYRMHPENIPSISAAKIDCCVLANNHVLDWGYPGLTETLETLNKAGIISAGAGSNLREAEAPAIFEITDKSRVVVFSFGSTSSGISWEWAAGKDRAGVNLLENLSDSTLRHIAKQVQAIKRSGDIVVASIHWGSNWGYQIPRKQRVFAHRLIDEAEIDIVHGHSSHHPKGIEVYRDKPIIYGCGDFLNDYEGISGYEAFRDDLSLMYFLTLDPSSGKLIRFDLVPTRIRRFRVNRASEKELHWLKEMLNREGEQFATRVELNEDNTLTLRW